jgi:List-Bact-rpt repeat protein/uncharacterized protein DUF11
VSTLDETDPSNNTSPTDTVMVTQDPPAPDLRIGKSHYGTFQVGSLNASYFLIAFSTAGPTTGAITITDTLPTGMTYNSIGDQSGGWSCTGTSDITCTSHGLISPGSFSYLYLKVDIADSAVGERTNTATASTPDDSYPANNTSAPDVVTVTPRMYSLTVTKGGSGSGTVTSNQAGINRGGDCTEAYADGTVVTLTATPAPGSVFVGWSGAYSGIGPCRLTMDEAERVTALFERENVGVQVSPAPGPPPPGGPALVATLAARSTCGPITSIRFGEPGRPFSNARVAVSAPAGGPANQTAGFTYTPPAGTRSVTLTFQRVVQSGSATVTPIHLLDGCGDWVTLVGGGPDAFR